MNQRYDPRRLDVKAFARDGGELSANESLSDFARLADLAQGEAGERRVSWAAQGEAGLDFAGAAPLRLGLRAHAVLPMVCQRCLELAEIELQVDRSFRFAADEAQVAELDEECDDDVLVLERHFNLHELVEDELIMALPLVPLHDVCPGELKMSVADADFQQEAEVRPNPFASLAGLQTGKR